MIYPISSTRSDLAQGNPDVHVILRGGSSGPNYTAPFVREAGEKIIKAGLAGRIMIDCSHGNSSKQHQKQVDVADDIASSLFSPLSFQLNNCRPTNSPQATLPTSSRVS